jgi:hypothetical protein
MPASMSMSRKIVSREESFQDIMVLLGLIYQPTRPVLVRHAVEVVLKIVSHATKVALCGLQEVIVQASALKIQQGLQLAKEICSGA